MAHYKKFVKDIGLVGAAQLLTNVRGFILLPVLTKTLGALDYGIWAQLTVTLNFLIPLTSLGLPNALIRFLPGSKEQKDLQEQIWSSAFFTFFASAGIAVLLFILAKPLHAMIQLPPQFMVFLAFLIVTQSLNNISSGIIQAFQEAKKLAAFLILSPLADIVFVSAAVLFGKGLYGAVLSFTIAKLLVFVVFTLLVAKKVGFALPNFSKIQEYLRFSIPTVAGNLSYRLVQVGDQYIIAAFLGILFVGYYAPAYSLGLILNMLTLPIGMVLPALLAKFFSKQNLTQVRIYLANTLRYVLLLLIPATFGLSVLARQLLEITSTKEITTNAFYVVPFVAVSSLLFAAQGIFVQVLYLFKKTREVGIIWFLGAVLNIGTNVVFIPRFGLIGAAATTLLAYTFVFAATWLVSARYLLFDIDWKTLFKSVVAASLMSLAIALFHPQGFAQTIAAVLGGVALYSIFLFALKGIHKKELEFLSNLFS